MRKQTFALSFGALLSALSLVVLFLPTLIPDGLLVFQAVAGLLIGVAVASCGLRTGFLVYGTTGLLSLILMPNKGEGLLFLIMFGLYPMIKSLAERRNPRWQRVILKGGFGALSITAALLLLTELLVPGVASKKLILIVGLPLGLGAHWLYDVAFTRLMNLYYVKLDPILKQRKYR